MEHCNREKEIDRLVENCEDSKLQRAHMETALVGIEAKIDHHIEAIHVKLDAFIATLNKSCETKDNRLDELEDDVSNLKKVLTIIKWTAIGAFTMLLLLNGAEWIPMVLRMIGL